MVFKLEISRDNTNYYTLDLFPNQNLEYSLDFYDSIDIDKIKIPFFSDIKIPLTTNNKLSSRFNYDPLTDTQDGFPKENFFYRITIFASTNIIISGILNVNSIEYLSNEPYLDVTLTDFVRKYISDLKDTSLADIYDAHNDTAWVNGNYNPTSPKQMSDFFDPTASGGERGTLGANPSSDRPIIFPYIDFCNDTEKFGYGARQFTEYSVGMDRAGIVPTFNVKEFLVALGDWFTYNGFETRIDSSLFGINLTENDANFEAEKLHMLLPCKLEAEQGTNTRNFTLNQAPYWSGQNEDLSIDSDLSGNEKSFTTDYFLGSPTFGNNGAFTTEGEDPDYVPVTTQGQYGLNVTNSPQPEEATQNELGNERGYFAPHMSFNADIDWSANQNFATLQTLKYEIPVLQQDKFVTELLPNGTNTTMTFGVFIGIYQDGVLIKKIRLVDSNGDDITLNATDASAELGESNKTINPNQAGFVRDYETKKISVLGIDTKFPLVADESSVGEISDTLVWDMSSIPLYLPDNQTIEIYGESRYGINYFVEAIDGNLDAKFGTNGINSNTTAQYAYFHYQTESSATAFNINDIRKAITRANDHENLNIKFTANSNFNPYFTTDTYNIKNSLENTCSITPVEIFTSICKRFGCGVFYSYDNINQINVLRIDPLHIVRGSSVNINSLVDDLKSVKLTIDGNNYKNLIIKNKDYDLYYDDLDNDGFTIGSTTQEINPQGFSDLELSFNSSIYFKSVCGEEVVFPDNVNLRLNVVTERELGITKNLFTKHQDIGVRFAYVDKPIYRSMLKVPQTQNKDAALRPNLQTTTQRIYRDWTIHTFNGRLRTKNIQNFDLRAEDDNGTTDYYDLIEANEKIKLSNNPSIEFDMVVETTELKDVNYFLNTFSCSKINASNILVKSVEGDVYESFGYLTIKGLLQ
jgi:hypothetical protein